LITWLSLAAEAVVDILAVVVVQADLGQEQH
jgi:hypothetical protein